MGEYNGADERASLMASRYDKRLPHLPRDTSDMDRASHQNSITIRRGITDAAKGVPCVDCGGKYPPYVMDFDHVRGIKVQGISEMIQKHCTLVDLHAEIAKCEVVCANCHRERTWGREKLDNAVYICNT